jgi:phytoene desaturase
VRIVIIGGGIGGLATANLLAKDGHTVDVYEKNDQLGGRAGQFKKDGFTFDTGPSWYLMPEVFERYYRELDTTAAKELDLIKLSPAYKIYSGAQPLTITGDIEKDAKTFEGIERGAGEALKQYVRNSTTTYRLALKHFLYSNFETPAPFLHKDVIRRSLTMVRLMTLSLHDYTKKYFHSVRLQQILEYPSVFLGSSPYTAPALYSLMSSLDFEEGVFYPRGTMHAIPMSLVKIGRTLGVTYHTNKPVSKVIINRGIATGVAFEDGSTVEADVVISNADLHFTETSLLPTKYQSYPEAYWKKIEASPSALLMYLGVKGSLPEFEHHTLLFTKDWEKNFDAIFNSKTIPSPASLYICKTSHSDITAPKGSENIFVLVPLPSGIEIQQPVLEKLADQYLEQIHKTTGVDLASRLVSRTLFGPDDFATTYNAWQSTMLGPSHKLSQSAFFRTPNKSKKVKNLYYVGAGTVPGVGVPMCLISAELVRQRIARKVRRQV